jgi:hypothetical protein
VIAKGGLGYFLHGRNDFGRVNSDRVCKLEKFDNVDAALTAFQTRHEGLVLANPGGKVGLRHPCGFPLSDEKVDKSLVTCRSERFSQLRPVSLPIGVSQ